MKIVIASDEAAFELKAILLADLKSAQYDIVDIGVYANQTALYPDIATEAAQRILSGEFTRGILLCGTGIGVSIAANKVKGIRAAQCHDTYSAERAKRSNDAHIITIGSRVVGPELAKVIARTFLNATFDGGSSMAKVDRISYYENLP